MIFAIIRTSFLVQDYELKGRDARCTMRQTLVPRKSSLVLKIYVSQKPPWLHTLQGQVHYMLLR